MNTSHLNGLAVITIEDGRNLGKVTEIFLDPAGQEIVALAVGAGGGLMNYVPPTSALLDASAINVIGPDAITVANEETLRAGATPPADLIPFSAVSKNKVMTEGGAQVGQLSSADFDPETRRLTQLDVSEGFLSGTRTVPMEFVVSIGADFVIVKDAVAHGQIAPEPAEEQRNVQEPAVTIEKGDSAAQGESAASPS